MNVRSFEHLAVGVCEFIRRIMTDLEPVTGVDASSKFVLRPPLEVVTTGAPIALIRHYIEQQKTPH
jgi:hypothetical protein